MLGALGGGELAPRETMRLTLALNVDVELARFIAVPIAASVMTLRGLRLHSLRIYDGRIELPNEGAFTLVPPLGQPFAWTLLVGPLPWYAGDVLAAELHNLGPDHAHFTLAFEARRVNAHGGPL